MSDTEKVNIVVLPEYSETHSWAEGGGLSFPGEPLTLEAHPRNDDRFAYWKSSTDPSFYSVDNPLTITTPDEEAVYEAVFEGVTEPADYGSDAQSSDPGPFTVTVSAEGPGTVSGGGSYLRGASCTIVATADTSDPTNRFWFWKRIDSDGLGVELRTSSTYTFTVNADQHWVAVFSTSLFTVKLSSNIRQYFPREYWFHDIFGSYPFFSTFGFGWDGIVDYIDKFKYEGVQRYEFAHLFYCKYGTGIDPSYLTWFIYPGFESHFQYSAPPIYPVYAIERISGRRFDNPWSMAQWVRFVRPDYPQYTLASHEWFPIEYPDQNIVKRNQDWYFHCVEISQGLIWRNDNGQGHILRNAIPRILRGNGF